MTRPDSANDRIAEARERLRAFWSGGSIGRPAVGIRVARPGFQPLPWTGPELTPKQRDLSPEWHAHINGNALDGTLFFGEALPRTDLCVGSNLILPGILAGADYEYEGSAWLKPVPGFWERPRTPFDARHPFLQGLLHIQTRLAQLARRQAYLNLPALLDPLTTLAALVGAEALCFDLLERPEDVRAAVEWLADLYVETYELFYRQACDLGFGETGTWLAATAPGRMEVAQCDFGVMLSPAQFEQFALPELRRISEYLDYSLYHLDGTCQTRFLDLLATLPKLNGIQWNPEPAAGSPEAWIDTFRQIRSRGWRLHVWCNPDEAVAITRALGPDGLFLDLSSHCQTPADAEEAIRRIASAC